MDAIFNIRTIANRLCGDKEKNAIETCCATPLVFVNLRKHNKSWTGQVEGVIQIARKLLTKYPNVGILLMDSQTAMRMQKQLLRH